MKLTLTLDIDPKELYRQRLFLCYIEKYDIPGGPIAGLLNLGDAIADAMADQGHKAALLRGTTAENTAGAKMARQLAFNVRYVEEMERCERQPPRASS